MQSFEFVRLETDGACLIKGFASGDNRGSFTKTFEKNTFLSNGIKFTADEIFTSVSCKNVIRGLHFQLRCPQAKLVTVLCGRAQDVIVDLRPESRTFGKWISAELNSQNNHALYIPRGFAHGFAALEENTVMLYQCEGAYDSDTDTGIRYDDPDIGIVWMVNKNMGIQSKRDLGLMSFKEYKKHPMEI